MRKNKMMRAASGLLVAVLLTTCIISGTFAKYTTTTEGTDTARVAVWGFNKDAVANLDLFDSGYDGTVNANDNKNVIAPGTTKTGKFSIINASEKAPEVKYNLTVSVDGSSIAESIKNNPNIVWQLDDGQFGNWDTLMTNILKLSGDNTVQYDAANKTSVTKEYAANKIPTEFATGKTHTITWKWIYDENAQNKETNTVNNDSRDTDMGNAAVNADATATVKITVTATQID